MRSPITERYLPKKLAGKELDALLARGWYRLGKDVFTCQFLFLEENLYSPIWIRLPLKKYAFRKRMRKIMSRNSRKFSFTIQPQNLTEEKEILYQKYRASFHSPIAVTLVSNLQDAAKTTVFNTQEICIYHEEKLVACSFFDIGEKSSTSILGIYDPDYQQDSLGFYSMLLEIEYSMNQGFDFYYPGYIVPQYDKFDYKLRIGKPEDVEFYDLRTATWQSQIIYDQNKTLTVETGQKLSQLSKYLLQNGISSDVLFYPCYEPYLVKRHSLQDMKSPLFLSCFSDLFLQPNYLIFYDYFTEKFDFYDCTNAVAKNNNAENNDLPSENATDMLDFMRNQRLIFETSNVVEIVTVLKKIQLKLMAIEYSKTDVDKV